MRKERGKVLQLRQRGDSWNETRGALYRAIMAGAEFDSGALRGRVRRQFTPTQVGRLATEWALVLGQDEPDYVLYSYNTPIAWHVPDDGDDGGERWVVPEVKYSTTTSRHQTIVRTALVFNGSGYLETLEEAQQGTKD